MISKKILISTIGIFVFSGCSIKSFDDLKSKIDEATTTYYSSGAYIESRDVETNNRGSIASGGSIVNRGSIVSGHSSVNRGSIASGGSSVGNAGSRVVIYNRKSYVPQKVTVRVLTKEELKRIEEENRKREAEFVERWRKRHEEAEKNSIRWEW